MTEWSQSVLEELSRPQLQAVAKEYGVKANLKNDQMIAEILNATAMEPQQPPEAVLDEAVAKTEVADQSSAEDEPLAMEMDVTVQKNTTVADASPVDSAEEAPVAAAAEPESTGLPAAEEVMSSAMEEMPAAATEAARSPPATETSAALEETTAPLPKEVDMPVAVPEVASSMVEETTHDPMDADEDAPKAAKEVGASPRQNGTPKEPAAALKSLSAAKRKLEEDQQKEANSAARREAMAQRREVNAKQRDLAHQAPDPYKPAPKPAKPIKGVPRVALLGSRSPRAKPELKQQLDRFATHDSIYHKTTETPSAVAYADAAKPSSRGGPTGMSFANGPADRFDGLGSRYRKGLRQSTMPIHDPKVYEAKQLDDSVPLPKVASMAPLVEKREIHPSNERFEGADSIYNAPAGPAVNAYDTSVDACVSSHHVVALDKQSQRFTHDSIYNAPAGPAVTAYDTSVDACVSSHHVVALDKQSQRFTHDSIYNAPAGPAVTAYDTSVDACVSSHHVVALDKQSQRFTHDSIYNAPAGPAVTAYDTSVDACVSSHHVVALDKQSQRFTHDSIYNAPAGPAVTAYDTSTAQEMVKPSSSSMVTKFESGNADRFAGPDSRYRKGLRQSTIPEERDASSFPRLSPVGKANSAAKGAALKAALKATMTNAPKLGAVLEMPDAIKENSAIE